MGVTRLMLAYFAGLCLISGIPCVGSNVYSHVAVKFCFGNVCLQLKNVFDALK